MVVVSADVVVSGAAVVVGSIVVVVDVLDVEAEVVVTSQLHVREATSPTQGAGQLSTQPWPNRNQFSTHRVHDCPPSKGEHTSQNLSTHS